MKKLLLATVILFASIAVQATDRPAADRNDTAALTACVRKNLSNVDDNVSPANVVASAIAQLCHSEIDAASWSFARSFAQNETRGGYGTDISKVAEGMADKFAQSITTIVLVT